VPAPRRPARKPTPSLRRFAVPIVLVVAMLLLIADAVWDLKTSEHVEVDPAQAEANAATLAWGLDATTRWMVLVVGVLVLGWRKRPGTSWRRWL
jgi:hypothetical protein